jgi:uncharacterized protein (TIGR02246 family)
MSIHSDEQAIRSLIATWLSASKAGDTKRVLNLMAEDVVFLTPGQPPMRGKAAFAASQAALREVEIDATSQIHEVKLLGEWAYCWTELTVTMTPRKGGPSAKRAGNTLSILKKQKSGEWLLVRDANMLSPVKD